MFEDLTRVTESFVVSSSDLPENLECDSDPSQNAIKYTSDSGVSYSETHDKYYNVVLIINDSWRVIRCCDDKQWILQKIKKSKGKWENKSFCVTRVGLERALKEKAKIFNADLSCLSHY